ncbi:MAG: Smr/MutS family protein [Desulfuromonadales bacterium]|nr:Smr/MutS family protein [Desulfuromonadales bacterium]
MGKKKRAQPKEKGFQSDPFRELKGFAVSACGPGPAEEPEQELRPQPELTGEDLFAREMSMLGVEPVAGRSVARGKPSIDGSVTPATDDANSERDLFLAALGEMTVRFEEQLPECADSKQAVPRRMKLLRQGRLQPEATLDLHGLLRHQVVEKVGFFLQDAQYQGFRTVLIITGRGLHSPGEPVLRSEVETFLQEDGRKLIAEWARAPRQYGGDGALIVFLKGCPDGL